MTVPAGGAGDGKFYVQAPTTPPGQGFLEICKSDANGVTGNFRFYVQGHDPTYYTVAAGSCSHPIKVNAGVQLVEEVGRTGYEFASVSASPADRVVNIDPTRHNISVRILAGGIGKEVVITFVNKHANGTVKICQVAGSGVAAGTRFGFTTNGTAGVTYVPASKASGGTCVVLGTFWVGIQLTVTQQIPTGDSVSAIVSRPTDRLIADNLANGTATLHIGSGVTEVRYTDTRP